MLLVNLASAFPVRASRHKLWQVSDNVMPWVDKSMIGIIGIVLSVWRLITLRVQHG